MSRNTTVKVKNQLFPQFVQLVKEQWQKGGKKYAGNEHKEWTDLICEAVGDDWILGTMIKYIGRIKNGDPRAKEDIIKVATYAFIYWIKNFTTPPASEKPRYYVSDSQEVRAQW